MSRKGKSAVAKNRENERAKDLAKADKRRALEKE